MLNLDGFIKLGEDIHVYHNFVSQKECEDMVKDIESIPEDKWLGRFNEAKEGAEHSTQRSPGLAPIKERLQLLLDKDTFLGTGMCCTRMKKGMFGPHHSDNFDFLKTVEASNNLKDDEDFDIAENNLAGIIIYFNDFEGGELHYSNQWVSYYPKAGDLVIHSSQNHCRHQVQELKSEIRYSYSSHLFNMIKVPKGFNDVP
jgi:hypothetical protein